MLSQPRGCSEPPGSSRRIAGDKPCRSRALISPWVPGLALCAVALTAWRAPGNDQRRPKPRPPARLLAVLIGGMDSDPSREQIEGTARRREGNSGLYQLAGDLRGERVSAEYFNWNGTRAGRLEEPAPPRSKAIADFVRAHLQDHPRDRVAIIGNSWGGHTALDVS